MVTGAHPSALGQRRLHEFRRSANECRRSVRNLEALPDAELMGITKTIGFAVFKERIRSACARAVPIGAIGRTDPGHDLLAIGCLIHILTAQTLGENAGLKCLPGQPLLELKLEIERKCGSRSNVFSQMEPVTVPEHSGNGVLTP